MSRVHTLLSGIGVAYPEPSPEFDAFLRELAAMAERPTTISELIGFAYGPVNPLLEEGVIPGRPAVTPAVLACPEWRVVMDVVDRGWLTITGEPLERLAEAYTVAAAEVAAQAGIGEEELESAIEAGTVRGWVRAGRYWLTADDADDYLRVHAPSTGLTVQCGHQPGSKLAFRADTPLQDTMRKGRNVVGGHLPEGAWKRAELFGVEAGKPDRYVVIEPAPTCEVEFARFGSPKSFFVRGAYTIVEEVVGVAARKAWLDDAYGFAKKG
jgi:hypothetical protein